MKKFISIIMILSLILILSSCSNSNSYNSLYVGEWYYAESPDEASVTFEQDGTFYVNEGTSSGTFKASKDSIILSDAKDDTNQVTGYLSESDGYQILDIEGVIYVKTYDNAMMYYEEYYYVDPSDIWAYDFSGDYYTASDDRLYGLSEYEQMVEVKTNGPYYVDQKHGGFTLTNNYSGYKYGSMDHAVTVDIDRENKTMTLVDSYGLIDGEYLIEWCEETQEFYFINEGYSSDTYWFKLSNVQ